MAGTIGIKIANGDFYPILEENSSVKKRLVLTTVHDGQESVQIDLFRSLSRSMLDAQYVGTLVVEDIKPLPKEVPSIEMIISSDQDGIISAEASVLASGSEHTQLNVSLKTLDASEKEGNFKGIDLERGNMQAPSGLYDETADDKNRKFPWWIMILATVFVVVAIALLWFFFLGGKETLPPAIRTMLERSTVQTQPFVPAPVEVREEPPPSPPLIEPAPPPVVVVIEEPPVEVVLVEEPAAEPEVVAEIETPVEEVLIIQAPTTAPVARPPVVERTRPPAPVSSYRVPAVIPRNGAPYQIQWGDTLWDISEAFYRNPWLYPRIARFNNISNPDLIISGRTIRIPPRN